MKKSLSILVILLFVVTTLFGQSVKFEEVKPTAFFKTGTINNEFQQVTWVKISNESVAPIDIICEINISGSLFLSKQVVLKEGSNDIELLLPDIDKPNDVSIVLKNAKTKKQLTSWNGLWQPQKKWIIHCVTYSHHDLGYGDIPHRLRRENRMENMELMLKYCTLTDSWPDDSKYRAVLETSEPITSYLSFCNKEKAEELKRRINEGRIQVSGIHTTVNTEMLGHETMARLFYLSNRHAVDMLGIKPSISTNFDDVIGITLPFYTFAQNAGLKNLFHGYNSPKMKFQLPAQDDPVFYMKGPYGNDNDKILVRSYYYSGDAIRAHHFTKPLGEDIVQAMVVRYEQQSWPFDVLMSQDGWDFTLLTLDNANRIKSLNETYVYPRMICSTMDMFFDDVRKQLDKYNVKTYQKDGNNQWADQPASDSKLIGEARRVDELIPTAEKLATISTILGNAHPWADIYQAYHRILLYHEHTCGSSAFKPAFQYATEQQEIREMVYDAADYTRKVLNNSVNSIAKQITFEKDNSLVVFNPMNYSVSQYISFDAPVSGITYKIIDNTTNKEVAVQKNGGKCSFMAELLPAMGYKTYTLISKKQTDAESEKINNFRFENKYYSIVFDSISGGIVSLKDKELDRELVDKSSPYKLNDYLYERYNVPGKEKISQFYGAVANRFESHIGAVADVITIHQLGEGSKSIIQTITLHKQKKQIDFRLDIDKTCSGRSQLINDVGGLTNKEALYVALPFDVPQYRFKHSLPGMSIEPIKQQFDSVSTASYGFRHFTSVYNSDFGITVAPIEASLIQYGFPRSDAMPGFWGTEHLFEKNPVYPKNSSIFLYLLNNMFDVNIVLTQPGEKSFSYSLTSYKVKTGNEPERFGWEIHNQPVVKKISGKQRGALPPNSFSFIQTDKENLVCTTFKPAEENGDGYILRFVETSGNHVTSTITLPVFDKIDKIEVTDLVENNTNNTVKLKTDNSFELTLGGFGVITLRLVFNQNNIGMPSVKAEPISDMRVKLMINKNAENDIYKVYRDVKSDFVPSLLTYIGETKESEFYDIPVLNYGNWINNVLLPNTTYYYKVVAYNKWNNRSEASKTVSVKTYSQTERNDLPIEVSGLKAILISDVSADNYVNVHWRSNCDSDIVKYLIHRGDKADFETNQSTYIGEVILSEKGNGSVYPLGEYDHQMFPDKNVKPNQTYYYKVCAVDAAGQKGKFTTAQSVTLKP